jgi:fused signal recognition particle receptor
MNQEQQMQWLGFIPTLYFEIGGIVLFCALGLWVLFSRRRRAERRVTAGPTGIAEQRKKDIQGLLAKTQEAFTAKLDALILSTKKFDNQFLDSLEELLYTSDLGPKTVGKLLEGVRVKVSRGELSDLGTVKSTIYSDVLEILNGAKVGSLGDSKPWVILVVGVNGVGKTTSIGKLAQYYSSKGKSVLVVAGDTFRAAAEQQLAVWGERANVEVYTSEQTKDPAAVAYQGIQKGTAEKKDVIIVDTAGRLHTKENLMEELKKVKRVAEKALPGAPHEVILVIDANSGQNARIQAQQFNEALGITSLIVTKLDGTAKGGVIVGIADEVGVGVQFIGTGEQIGDLEVFSSQDYAKGLLRL